jgi:two-component system cell cycle sensor histidine kinase/response regulator CckA
MSWTLVILLLLAAGSTVCATFAYLSTYRRLKRLEAEMPEGRGEGREPGFEANAAIRRLAGLLDALSIGAYAADRTGRVLYVNGRLAGWLGMEPEALPDGTRTADWLLPRSAGEPAGEPGDESGDEPGDESVEMALSEGSAAAGELALCSRDGASFAVWVAQDPIGEAGGVEGVFGIVRRLDQPGAAAPAAEPAEPAEDAPSQMGAYKRFFDATPVGIVVIDSAGSVLDHNGAALALAGLSPPAPAGLQLSDLVDDGDHVRLQELLEGNWDTPTELRMAGGAGRVCALHLTRLAPESVSETEGVPDTPETQTPVTATPAAQGGAETAETRGDIVVHFIDTTELKSLEAQFAQSQKMQAVGQLAGGIAHDFNNLLTAMIGFSDLLLLRHRPGDQSFADIMHIKQNANRAAGLVRQLLAFSRQQTLQPRVLDITDILAELSNLLRRLIGETIELNMVHGRDLGAVKADQGQLEQVIINLAVNARDAMPEGGTLTIETDTAHLARPLKRKGELIPAGDYVRIRVTDTGCGIAADELDRIFEPFYSTKEVGAGTGLGLSTVDGIVSQTGGFLEVESRLGEGASFAIYLPQHVVEEAAAEGETVAVEASRDLTGRGTVLLVEDEDAVRAFGARALKNKGYNVLEANSGEAALEVLSDDAQAVDLLITDVVMPRLDGPSLVRQVRETRPEMPVIFISGYAEDSFRQRLGREAGIHFLPKPFTLKDLAGKVKEVMGEQAA